MQFWQRYWSKSARHSYQKLTFSNTKYHLFSKLIKSLRGSKGQGGSYWVLKRPKVSWGVQSGSRRVHRGPVGLMVKERNWGIEGNQQDSERSWRTFMKYLHPSSPYDFSVSEYPLSTPGVPQNPSGPIRLFRAFQDPQNPILQFY